MFSPGARGPAGFVVADYACVRWRARRDSPALRSAPWCCARAMTLMRRGRFVESYEPVIAAGEASDRIGRPDLAYGAWINAAGAATAAGQHERAVPYPGGELGRQPGLTAARLRADQHDPRRPGFCCAERTHQHGQFVLPARENRAHRAPGHIAQHASRQVTGPPGYVTWPIRPAPA